MINNDKFLSACVVYWLSISVCSIFQNFYNNWIHLVMQNHTHTIFNRKSCWKFERLEQSAEAQATALYTQRYKLSVCHAQPHLLQTTNKSFRLHRCYSTSRLILEDVVTDNQNHNYGYSGGRGTFWKWFWGDQHSSIYFYRGLSASNTLDLYVFAFKGAKPRHSEMRWNAAKNFKCTFNTSPSYWRLGGNLSFLFLSFQVLESLVNLWMCVYVCVATFISPHRLLSMRGEMWGGWKCNGNHFFCDCAQGLKWLLQRTFRLILQSANTHTHIHITTHKPWRRYAIWIVSIPLCLPSPTAAIWLMIQICE